MLNTVIISAFYPLLLKIENDKNNKRTIRGRKSCNFKKTFFEESDTCCERNSGSLLDGWAFKQRRKIIFFLLFQRDQFAIFWFKRIMTSHLPVREIIGKKLIYSWWKQWFYMLNTVIISASDPLLLKIENEKYYKRSIRGRKFCNFKNILRRGRYLVVRDIWVSLSDG